jgi:hypothetical protein
LDGRQTPDNGGNTYVARMPEGGKVMTWRLFIMLEGDMRRSSATSHAVHKPESTARFKRARISAPMPCAAANVGALAQCSLGVGRRVKHVTTREMFDCGQFATVFRKNIYIT